MDNMIGEKAALEKKIEGRLHADLASDRDDQHWLDGVDTQLDELAEKIQLLEKDLEWEKKECLAMGLVDKDGKPANLRTREQLSFSYWANNVDSGHEISDLVKYPVLLPRPGTNPRRNYEPMPKERLDTTRGRINQWILNQLRSSLLEVNLLTRTFEAWAGETTLRKDDWQAAVLKFWYEDRARAGLLGGDNAYLASTLFLDPTE
jgi:hypothetical protein